MSAQIEAFHVDGNKDENVDVTLEGAELQSTVLTLESILIHVCLLFFVLSALTNQTLTEEVSFWSAVNFAISIQEGFQMYI